uniref:Uncharacterized protein n=1 Tax=Daphnia galeata TaxID=27404 RepID=A0A8J2RRV0_9CRUS|nr:unnamed protein product [Daphnia galeata]
MESLGTGGRDSDCQSQCPTVISTGECPMDILLVGGGRNPFSDVLLTCFFVPCYTTVTAPNDCTESILPQHCCAVLLPRLPNSIDDVFVAHPSQLVIHWTPPSPPYEYSVDHRSHNNNQQQVRTGTVQIVNWRRNANEKASMKIVQHWKLLLSKYKSSHHLLLRSCLCVCAPDDREGHNLRRIVRGAARISSMDGEPKGFTRVLMVFPAVILSTATTRQSTSAMAGYLYQRLLVMLMLLVMVTTGAGGQDTESSSVVRILAVFDQSEMEMMERVMHKTLIAHNKEKTAWTGSSGNGGGRWNHGRRSRPSHKLTHRPVAVLVLSADDRSVFRVALAAAPFQLPVIGARLPNEYSTIHLSSKKLEYFKFGPLWKAVLAM